MTALDTAYNYLDFASHRTLARFAGDLLGRFEISTKVGYFPGGHDLDPSRLRRAVEQAAADLGRAPDTVFLHNPEHNPGQVTRAAEVLAAARDEGLCRAWGISTWNPAPLLRAAAGLGPCPDALMVRVGLTVPAAVLDAAQELAERSGSPELWGMAPFAGSTTDPIWSTVDASVFLDPGQHATTIQAGFAATFELPPVARIAVGTQKLQHLDELITATGLAVDTDTVANYRTLLRQAATVSQTTDTTEREHAAVNR